MPCHSATDIKESSLIGRTAVETAVNGASGEMMIFARRSDSPYECEVTHKAVSEIANEVHNVPDAYINAEGNGITDACVDYILPLIAGEVAVEYQGGIPKHIVI